MTKFLTTNEAAEYLRVSPATINKWSYERRIPFRKHGSRRLFSVEDLNRWSEEKRVEVMEDEHDNLLSSLKSEYQGEFE